MPNFTVSISWEVEVEADDPDTAINEANDKFSFWREVEVFDENGDPVDL